MKDPLGLMGLTSPEQWVPPRAGSSSETHAPCVTRRSPVVWPHPVKRAALVCACLPSIGVLSGGPRSRCWGRVRRQWPSTVLGSAPDTRCRYTYPIARASGASLLAPAGGSDARLPTLPTVLFSHAARCTSPRGGTYLFCRQPLPMGRRRRPPPLTGRHLLQASPAAPTHRAAPT